MKAPLKEIVLCCLLISAAILSYSQVVINEFSAANVDDHLDNFQSYEDWIELFNTGNSSVNLSGYHLSDRENKPTKWQIPNGVSIPANGRLVFYASGRDEVNGTYIHTNFKITQTRNKEDIIFSDPDGVIIDQHKIEQPNQANHSWGRVGDGGTDWGLFSNPSPRFPNSTNSKEYATAPTIGPAAGVYDNSVIVYMENDDPSLTIRYTTNGRSPNTNSPIYTEPLFITETTVVKAVAYSSDNSVLPSFMDFHTYFIDSPHTMKIVAISGGGELDDLMDGGWNSRPIGCFELFDDDGERVSDATGEFNKHGNDSWAYNQRGIDYITRDEEGYDYAVKNNLFDMFDTTERDRFQRLILKAAANDNYPNEFGGAHIRDAYVHTLSQLADLEMDERSYEPCVLYVNGEYWGVYEIREKVDDHDFTDQYYDQDEEDIDFIKTWGGTWEEYGSADDWYSLRNYVFNNDMTNPTNYAYVEERLEVLSLIDYVILHAHIVSADWLNYNTAWWRGRNPEGDATKWRYILWDEDASFGHYINYTGIPDQSANADPCDPEEISFADFEGHIGIFSSLYENENFRNLYINRYADLNNTYFSCEYMTNLLDQMIDRIDPEMNRQIDKWGGTYNGWQNNVDALRDFILQRCTNIDDGIVDCYADDGVSGPYDIRIRVEPEGSGRVGVNTVIGENYPWNVSYFGGVEIDMTALANDEWIFDHWETNVHSFAPDATAEEINLQFSNPDIITAFFRRECLAAVPTDYSITLCEGESQLINGTLYDATNPTGEELLVGQASNGCDSLVQVNVSFPSLPTGVLDLVLCEGTSELINGTLYDAINSTGEELLVGQASNGCDSLVQVNVSFSSLPTGVLDLVLCEGASEMVNGTLYDAANPTGEELLVGEASNGCDSLIQVNVSFSSLPTGVLDLILCEGTSELINGTLYDATNSTGEELLVGEASNGCDSLVQVNVSFSSLPMGVLDLVLCEGESQLINGTLYDAANPTGEELLLGQSFTGCDSLLQVNVSFNLIITNTIQENLCSGESIVVNDVIYDENNTSGEEQLTSISGCDSLIIVELNFLSNPISMYNPFLCDGGNVLINNIVYDQNNPSGQEILTANNGCDSTVMIDLQFYTVPNGELSNTLCKGESILVNGVLYDENNPTGNEMLTNASSTGCDSLVTINLSYLEDPIYNLTETRCANTNETINGTLYDASNPFGTEILEAMASNGCDSIVQINFTFEDQIMSVINDELCDGETLLIEGVLYDVSNPTGQQMFTAGNGCDSLVMIDLSFRSPINSMFEAELCSGDSYMINGTTYDENNPIGQEVLTANNGCDSIVSVALTTVPQAIYLMNNQLCAGESQVINGTLYDAFNPSGVEVLAGAASNGCDSMITIDLGFYSEVIEEVSTTLCETESYIVNGVTYDIENPIGSELLENASINGCDSLVMIDLSFESQIEASVQGEETLCQGEEYELTFSLSGSNAYDLIYSVGDDAPELLTGITDGHTLMLSPEETTTFSIESVENTNLCQAIIGTPLTIQVSNIAGSIVSSTDYGAYEVSCPDANDGAIMLIDMDGIPPFSYNWNTGSTNVTLENLSAGIYQLTLTDAAGCSVIDEIELTEPNPLEYDITTEMTSCVESTGSIFLGNLSGGNDDIEYALDGVNFLPVENEIAINNLDSGSYTLYLQDMNDCQTTENIYVDIATASPFELGEPMIVTEGDNIILNPNIFDSNVSYQWASSQENICDTCSSLVISPITDTYYQLTITDANNCTYSDSILVMVEAQIDVFSPNVFSPNGDGINDFWTIFAGASVTEVIDLHIFDRWGTAVFRQQNFQPNEENLGWDGTFRNKNLDPSVFVYHAIIQYSNGTTKQVTGDIVLLR